MRPQPGVPSGCAVAQHPRRCGALGQEMNIPGAPRLAALRATTRGMIPTEIGS
jgi:hypothetical protein